MIAAVVAYSRNYVIGRHNDLPWDLPADRRHFRAVTRGHTVLMGRKTYDSIVARLGHGLPDRTNIIVTRDQTYRANDAVVAHSLDEALDLAGSDTEVMIIGGEQIYKEMLPHCDRLYVTEVEANIDGDAYFPSLNQADWREVSRERHAADDTNKYDYSFVVYNRVT